MGGAGMQGIQPPADRKTLLQFMAEGIKQHVPNATVNITNGGLEIIFTKEAILQQIFTKAGNLAQIADVEVDARGIVVKIRI